jgi:hypothetical protein
VSPGGGGLEGGAARAAHAGARAPDTPGTHAASGAAAQTPCSMRGRAPEQRSSVRLALHPASHAAPPPPLRRLHARAPPAPAPFPVHPVAEVRGRSLQSLAFKWKYGLVSPDELAAAPRALSALLRESGRGGARGADSARVPRPAATVAGLEGSPRAAAGAGAPARPAAAGAGATRSPSPRDRLTRTPARPRRLGLLTLGDGAQATGVALLLLRGLAAHPRLARALLEAGAERALRGLAADCPPELRPHIDGLLTTLLAGGEAAAPGWGGVPPPAAPQGARRALFEGGPVAGGGGGYSAHGLRASAASFGSSAAQPGAWVGA